MFDEMYSDNAEIREHYLNVNSWLRTMSSTAINKKNVEAESQFKRIGITFSMDYLGFFGYEQSTDLLTQEPGNFTYGL